MKACTSCGRTNLDDARFCSSCGSALGRGCARCGAELAEGARFCSACGASVEAPAAAPPGQERRLVTILFADVTGSTSLGERLDPEHLQEVLETYFAAMRQEIEAEGGTVEKFIGDAVMAAFGVPTAHEDDPVRAVRAALRMRRRLFEVNRDLADRFGVELEIRTGVNTGEVLASIDAPPGTGLVTGDAVNVAARLEQSAEPGEIVVAERTARAARSFRYRTLGVRAIRGKDTPVPASVLIDEAPERAERGIPGLRAPIVGRDRELDLLRSVLQRSAADGRPNLVTIYGDPGVGKSRLVHEFVTGPDATIADTTLRGRCLPYGDGITYWPLAEILKSWAGVFDDDTSAEVLAKIHRSTESVLTDAFHPDPRRATATLAHTVGVDDPEIRLDDLDPSRMRDETHAAWRSFFSAVAAPGPLLVVVEDIHWADPALLDLLEELAERAVGPVVFLCPARPELVERRPGWGGGRRNFSSVALDPLSEADSHRLIELLLEIDDLPAPVRKRILARAEGNPFFLEEIVRYQIDEGRIRYKGGRWRAAAGIEDVEVPDTVQAVLAARIDLLEPADKRTLQRAAVVGRTFWPGPVRRLLNGDEAKLSDALARFEERDLVLPRLASAFVGEREFSFKHVLTYQVAYESLPRRERVDAHAEVAQWLEETAGDRRDEFVELLAHHYGSAYAAARDHRDDAHSLNDLRAQAYVHSLAAARAARRKIAFQRATRLARDAVELAATPSERAEALEVVGRVYHDDHRGDESHRAFREAVDVLLEGEPTHPRIPMLCALAVDTPTRWPGIMMHVPPVDEVVRYLDLGLAHVGDGDSEEHVRLLNASAFLPFATFGEGWDDAELDRRRMQAEAAYAMAERLGRPDLASAALDGVGAVQLMGGHFDEMLRRDARRLALADRIDDPAEIADACSAAANGRIAMGRFREAFEIADRGYHVAFDSAPSYGTYALVWSTVAAFCLGDWDEVLERFDILDRFLGGRTPTRPWLQGYAVAAFVRDARGDRLEADRLLVPVREGAPTQSYRSVTGAAWVARLLARRGLHDEARTWADAITLRESSVLGVEAACEQASEAREFDRLDAIVARANAASRRSRSPLIEAYVRRLIGRATAVRGDLAEAGSALDRARSVLATTGAAWEVACTDLALADLAVREGRRGDGGAALDRSRNALDAAGARRELDTWHALERDLA